MRWTGHAARMGEMRNAYILGRKPEGKIQLRRRRYRREDNIKTDLSEVRCDDAACIHLAQMRG
jgi:hypothetical protein